MTLSISIITAVYNRVATIAEALDSVSRQSFADVEHLVIDAQSTDGTLDEIARCRTPAMRVVSEPDQGIYDALNKGMRLSSGNILGIVHSDDVLAHKHVLSLVAAAFADPSIDAVYGDLDYVAHDNPERIVRRWRSGTFHHDMLRRGWMPPHPALFIRREVFETHGGYDTRYRIAADYEAIMRWFGKGAIRAAYIPEVLVKMRLGGVSNRSLGHIWRKSCEDLRALRSNGVGGIGSLVFKNLGKIEQFFVRS